MRSQTLFKKYALIKKRNRNQTWEKDNRRMQQRDISKANFRLTVSLHTLFSGIYDIGTKVSSSLVTSRLTEGNQSVFFAKAQIKLASGGNFDKCDAQTSFENLKKVKKKQ